jgi:hypothetical protein
MELEDAKQNAHDMPLFKYTKDSREQANQASIK